MPNYRIHLISEPASAYEFIDPRPLQELCDAIVRSGYCMFEGVSNRLGNANHASVHQTVFAANIAKLIEH
ncbi:MAG: hypothetical protein P4M09_15850 [Devosia sp.]|nr:hypothetical protein [Devosia sp.]